VDGVIMLFQKAATVSMIHMSAMSVDTDIILGSQVAEEDQEI
jgi:hypothetical protein